MQTIMNKKSRVGFYMLIGPLLFLIVVLAIGTYISVSMPLDQTETAFQQAAPYILLLVQVLLLFVVVFHVIKNKFNIKGVHFSFQDILWGICIGGLYGLAYKYIIADFLFYLQSHIGDYIPPQPLHLTLGKQTYLFLVANVFIAPFVEEYLYRGPLFQQIAQKRGTTYAIVFSSIAFGLLHWMGGFWYTLITGVLIGLPFSMIALHKNGFLMVFVIHFTLNLIEFYMSI